MRLPSAMPEGSYAPTLGQLRERRDAMYRDGWAHRLVTETETIGDRMSRYIADREIALGLRPAPVDPSTTNH